MDSTLAFISHDDPLEIRVNFGVFAGREATPAEIDELAATLRPEVETVSIVSEQRHEIGDGVEAAVHQVRIEVPDTVVPDDVAERLLDATERWAEACIEARSVEVSEL